MPKKPSSKRLDKLFEGMEQNQAKPHQGPGKKAPSKPAGKKPAQSAAKPVPTRPIPLAQTGALPPLESVSIAQRGGSGTPASMSLGFQMDSRNWATLQVVDEVAERKWDSNEQMLVKQVVDQLSQALENARLFQETRSRAEELAVLNEMGRELSRLLDIEGIAKSVYKHASRLMDTTNLFISLYDEASQEINPFFVINDRERVDVPPRKLGKGLSDHILRTREPLFIPDDVPGHMRQLGLEIITLGDANLAQCWLGAPLLIGDTILGVIGLQSVETPNLFTERHRDLLTAISSQAAIAIQNARLFEETQRRTEELNTLNELNQRLSARLDVEQVLQEIYRGVSRLIDTKNFYIGLYYPERNEVEFPLNVTESVMDKSIAVLRADQGIAGYILEHQAPILIKDRMDVFLQSLGIETVGELARSWLGVPLMLGNQVIGVMAVQSYDQPNKYNEHDRDLLQAFAGQAAISIQNARLFTETQRRAREIGTLAAVANEIAIAHEIQPILEGIGGHAAEYLGLDEVAILLIEPDGNTMRAQFATGKYRDEILAETLYIGKGIAGSIAQTGKAEIVNEPDHDPRSITITGTPEEEANSEIMMVAPIIGRGNVAGVIIVWRERTQGLFAENDLNFLVNLARQAAIALDSTGLFAEVQQRSRQLASLNEIVTTAAQSLDLKAILSDVLQKVFTTLDFEGGLVTIFNEAREKLERVVRIGLPGDVPDDPAEGLEGSLCEYVYQTGEVLAISDMRQGAPVDVSNTIADGFYGYLGIPLNTKGKAIGTLCVFRKKADRIPDNTVVLGQSIGNQIGFAIENARLFGEARKRTEELNTLNELNQRLSARLDVEQVLQEIYRGVSRLIDTKNFYIGLYYPERNEVEFPLNVTESVMDKSIAVLRADQGVTGHILKHQAPILVKDRMDVFLQSLGIETVGELARSWLGVPLMLGNQVIGVMAVQSYDQPNKYNEHDRDLLQAFAGQASIAIQNARLFDTEQARRKEAETLYNASRAITSARNEDEIFTGVVENLDHTNVDRIIVAIAEEYSGELWAQIKGVWDRAGKQARYIGNRFSAKQIPAMIQTFAGEIIRVEDFSTSTEIDEVTRSTYQHLGIKSALVIPIRGRTTQGWIQLLTTSAPRTFRDEDVRSYLTLAQQIAIAMESHQNAAGLALVNRIVSALTMAASLEDALGIVVHEIVEGFPVARGAITLRDENQQGFTVIADHSKLANAVSVVGLKIPLEGNIATQSVVSTCKPYIVKDASRNPVNPPSLQEEARRIGIDYTAIFPISRTNEVIGTLGLDIAGENAILNQDQIALVEAALSPISAAIERLRAEESLARSETELRALFAAMTDVIVVYDREGRYVRIAPTNPSRLFLPPQEMLGKLISEVLPERIAQILMSAIKRALETGETVPVEYPLNINQVEYWFEGAISKMTEEQVFLVVRDITGRKKAEESLRESEERFRTILENIEDGYFEVDLKGNFTFSNPALAKMIGYEVNDMMGMNNRQYMRPEVAKTVLQTFNRIYETGKPELAFDWELLRRDGTPRSIESSVSLIKAADGSIEGFRGIVRDVTERKHQEETLRRRNAYLSATAEIGRLVTSTLDMPTLLSRTVNLVRDRFGFYHAGIFVTEETGFRAVLQAATGEAGAEMLRQGHGLQVGSKSIVGSVTGSGQPFIVNETAASESHRFNPLLPETRAEAAIPLRVGTRTIGALDIQSTVPNAFSEDDIAVLQSLADQVAIAIDNARSYELSMQAVKEMREADRLKSQFLANMSHELRTPLNSIIGFSRVILKGIDGPTTDLQQQDLLAIHNSGQHLLGLINDILDLSRIEAGKMELTFDEVNLAELITSVMSTVTGLVKDKPIALHRQIPQELPTVRADPMRVRQVLLNLLSNAAKFTDEGSITVKAGVADSPGGHPEIIVSVTDTGPGIAAEDLKKLFQPFSQVDASPTRKSGGSGLGLSISNHLIQMHGGHITVESAPGKGSTFSFTIPAFRGKNETGFQPGPRTILAIDDDPQVVSLYERYLQPQGYQVVSLADPSRAVERVRQLKPFAVTLDIMMPGYDGWRVLNDLKSNPETRDVPVVVCSIVEDKEKGFNLGATDYLVKPILEDELLETLDRLNIDGSIREVLIVDDDPNDLRLVGQMLSENGRYRPILAEGGRNGLDTAEMRTPHAIILDLFMPEMDGFTLLEKLQSNKRLRDIPVIVISGGDLNQEQKQQLQDFGHRLIQKSMLNEKQLVAALERALKRVKH